MKSNMPSTVKNRGDEGVMTIARDIEEYLAAHPCAIDSLEGITKWWLTRHHYEQAYEDVQDALDYLVEKRVVSKRTTAGKTLYAYALKRSH